MPLQVYLREKPAMATEISRQPMVPAALIIVTAAFVSLVSGRAQEAKDAIETGRTVAFEYTVSEQGGSIVDTNIGSQPIEYVHGEGQILTGLENALSGMSVGDEKSVTLRPEDAYGPADPAAFRDVPTEQIPEEARNVGVRLAVPGIAWPVLVNEVRPDSVVLDLNHPFAGKTLVFVVRILSIR
jgi:FKBP-type peptidyl-prolyl cis-trans isomerase 2